MRVQLLLRDPATSLRIARSAWDRRDYRRAEWLLKELADRYPVIADHADWMRARVLTESSRHEQAADLARRALASYPSSFLRSDFYRLLGDTYAYLGDEEAARLAWRGALDETRDSARRAALLKATAVSEERSGRARAAARTYALLWSLHPTSPQAEVAEKRLEVLSDELQMPLRDASDWRRRGDMLFRERLNQEAFEAYERALELGLSESEARRARKQQARALFYMRRYPEAVRAFRALPDVDDVALWRARSLARAGDVPQAIRELEDLARSARGGLGLRAAFLAAVLLEDRGEKERARRQLRKLARNRGTPGLANAALWRLGWGSYRDARYGEAVSLLETLLLRESHPIDALRARYWRARALEQVGDADSSKKAVREFASMAREYPFSYYGWRARERVPACRLEVSSERPPSIGEGTQALDAEVLARPRILLAAGLVEEAVAEMKLVQRRARGLSDRLTLAQLLTEAGDYPSAQRLVVDAYTEPLARGPVPSLEELWWHAWPAAYSDLVAAATSSPGSVERALVLSIMREESGFRPRAVSPNGARGLLQIMTSTGERLALSLGQEDFSVDDLFEPEVNIRLGSHYLGELSRRFEGRLSAAIAGYNAGPQKVSEWVAENGGLDEDDEWVEAIPYSQTRAYVKRVLRSLQAYRVLY